MLLGAALAAAPALAQQFDEGVGDGLGSCVPDATHLCFYDGRFTAFMTYETPGGPISATAVQPAGGKPGFFRFGDANVAELWMDVLDGCSINSHMWVTFLGVSDQGWFLRVDDHHFNQWKSYTVPTGAFGPPITQTDSSLRRLHRSESRAGAASPAPAWTSAPAAASG